MPSPTRLERSLPRAWSAIETAWEPSLAALRGGGLDEDDAFALAMVARELLENAVKYGDPASAAPMRLTVDVGADEIVIEVTNPVAPDDAQLQRFDRAVQWIRGFQDPFEAYVERLKLVSAESYRGGQSGLGLTRIAYEARCLVDFWVDEAGTLAVSATCPRSRGARAA
jgi:hypothetical protein